MYTYTYSYGNKNHIHYRTSVQCATPVINAFEIFYSAHKSQMKNQNIKETDKLLDKLEVIPLELPSARKAAEISAKLAEKGDQSTTETP
jgi:predicted nucleic acid-binding protein